VVSAGVYGQTTYYKQGLEAGVYGVGSNGIVGVSSGDWDFPEIGYGVGAGVLAVGDRQHGIVAHTDAMSAVSGMVAEGAEDKEGVWAGEFEANVRVWGDLVCEGNKYFRIDHPLDPANKYLMHCSVESSERLNVYSGKVTLDRGGEAWVELPGWLEAVNGDFRYQLTAVGGPAPNLHVAQELLENRFKISGGTPGTTVSWQVVGTRRDAYARAHPLRVEVEKPGSERATFLHPVELGFAEETRLNYRRRRALRERIELMRRARIGLAREGGEEGKPESA